MSHAAQGMGLGVDGLRRVTPDRRKPQERGYVAPAAAVPWSRSPVVGSKASPTVRRRCYLTILKSCVRVLALRPFSVKVKVTLALPL